MATSKNDGRWRRIAGSLELFLGSYFAACGCLGILFFITLENRDGVMLSALAMLVGMLLVFRAGHLLQWRPWLFRTVAFVMIVAPIAWVTPAFLSASVETSAARHRRDLAANIRVRSVKAYDLAPVETIKRFPPAMPDTKYAQTGARWVIAVRDGIQTVTADTFVWCMEKLQSFKHYDDEQRQ